MHTVAKVVVATGVLASSVLFTSEPVHAATNLYARKLGVSPGQNADADLAKHFLGEGNMGASWVRLTFSWQDMEEVQNKISWATADAQVNKARYAGLKVLVAISYAPTWAQHRSCKSQPCAPAADRYDEYALFVKKVAHRYGTKVGAFEIWNEPNEKNFWDPTPNPKGYATMLKLAYHQIRSVSSARVVFGGMSTHYPTSTNWLTWRQFLKGFYAAGGAPYDHMGIHPYYSGGRPSRNVPDNPFFHLSDLRKYMVDHGASGKHIWITEFGYETGALSELGAADRLKEALTMAVRWSYVDHLFIFSWLDFQGPVRLNTFGLNHKDGTPKVARGALKKLVAAHNV